MFRIEEKSVGTVIPKDLREIRNLNYGIILKEIEMALKRGYS